MRSSPPSSVKPEALFRVLLGRPRPSVKVDQSIAGVELRDLEVRALSSLEISSIIDQSRSEYGELQAIRESALSVVASVYLDGKRLFDSERDLDALEQSEFDELCNKVAEALSICSPTYEFSDVSAWSRRLAIGAGHVSNVSTAYILAGCIDMSQRGTVYRPDRYFGFPLADMTDGHWMAFRAACKYVDSKHGNH